MPKIDFKENYQPVIKLSIFTKEGNNRSIDEMENSLGIDLVSKAIREHHSLLNVHQTRETTHGNTTYYEYEISNLNKQVIRHMSGADLILGNLFLSLIDDQGKLNDEAKELFNEFIGKLRTLNYSIQEEEFKEKEEQRLKDQSERA